jgi:hypothetical protein
MGKLSQQIVGAEVMEHARVNYPHFDAIDSQVVSNQDVKAVSHYSVANLAHRVTRVLKVTLK